MDEKWGFPPFVTNYSVFPLTCEIWPPNSNQAIHEFKWMFVRDVMKFPFGIPDILRSQQRELTWPCHFDLQLQNPIS